MERRRAVGVPGVDECACGNEGTRRAEGAAVCCPVERRRGGGDGGGLFCCCRCCCLFLLRLFLLLLAQVPRKRVLSLGQQVRDGLNIVSRRRVGEGALLSFLNLFFK